MSNKKFLRAAALSLAVLFTACSAGGTGVTETVPETVSETAVAAAETTAATSETTAKAATSETVSETTAVTEKKLTKADLGVNEDGTLNDTFTKRIEQLMEPHIQMAMGSVYPTLWDFDEDGVPEIILIFHSGSQGSMPCEVYDPKTLEQIGEFDGFCRDGFTRFINRYDGSTVIYSYYEHSNWQREETVNFVTIQNGKLVSDKKITRYWQTGDNMINAAMVVYSDNSDEANGSERDFLDYKFGDVCTSYGNFDIDVTERAAAVVESYNNYIKVYEIAKEEYPVGCAFIGKKNEAAVYGVRGEGFFMDENGEVTQLESNLPYVNIYKLDDDIIVCEQFGNTSPCDVYIMVDGKPVLDKKISGQGHAMTLSRSKLYNDEFEITESVYDATSFGSHTFKTYQLYRDKDGFHEYGSIVVPIEDFNKYYGEAAQVFVDDIAKEWGVSVDVEIYEVLYRSDSSFILNCRSPLLAGDNDDICGYNFYNITLKPNTNGELTEVYRDLGVYKTALIPEIAVYPEKMYVPEEN